MINIIKQEIEIDETLKRRLEIICDFCNIKPEIINGSIRKVDKTNLSYIEPHRVIINGITYFKPLDFNFKFSSWIGLFSSLSIIISPNMIYIINLTICNTYFQYNKNKKRY